MPDAHQLRMRRERLELRIDVRRLQVYPADDAPDEWVLAGKPEQPPRFLESLARLHGDIMKAMATQDMRDRLTAIAMIPVANTPEEFTVQVKNDIARWGKVIREGGIKVD